MHCNNQACVYNSRTTDHYIACQQCRAVYYHCDVCVVADSKHYALCSSKRHRWPLGVLLGRIATDKLVLRSRIDVTTDGLGAGAFAQVFKGKFKEKEYAVKVFSKEALKAKGLGKDLVSEIELHLTLDHPHIIKLRYVSETPTELLILYELAPNGNLARRSFLKQNI